jgi:ABC-type multidrug transport system fused ATPase/permease subunit
LNDIEGVKISNNEFYFYMDDIIKNMTFLSFTEFEETSIYNYPFLLNSNGNLLLIRYNIKDIREPTVEEMNYLFKINESNINNKEIKIKSDDIIQKFTIMCFLFSLAKVLMGIMLIAIILGSVGFLCAIFVSIKGVKGIFDIKINDIYNNNYISYKYHLILFSISIGLLRYGEQFCNHYIAFKLLAEIRHKIFSKLRTLCPAKLENKEKGNLISLITSDIELIEVFYAHTISPVAIAFIVSTFMTIYISSISFKAGIISFFSYIFIGIIIPLIFTKKVEKISLIYPLIMAILKMMKNIIFFYLNYIRVM